MEFLKEKERNYLWWKHGDRGNQEQPSGNSEFTEQLFMARCPSIIAVSSETRKNLAFIKSVYLLHLLTHVPLSCTIGNLEAEHVTTTWVHLILSICLLTLPTSVPVSTENPFIRFKSWTDCCCV